MRDWLPGLIVEKGNDSGSWARDDEDAPKILLHTTEGLRYSAALGAYRTNNSWPHFTVDPVNRLRWQHVPLSKPARALRNTSKPGETNREGRVYQIEILGFAGQSHTWTGDQLDWLGTDVLAPIAAETGTPLVSTVEFFGEGAGWILASERARQRLSPAAWDTYTGVLGHQHAPENTHWDPGAIDIDRILAAARGLTPEPPPEEDPLMAPNLSEDVKREIADIVRSEILKALQQPNERIVRLEKELLEPTGPKGETRADRMARIPDAIKALEAKVDAALAG